MFPSLFYALMDEMEKEQLKFQVIKCLLNNDAKLELEANQPKSELPNDASK